ncbi:MAG: 16S rRNA (guanine(527)-N(7))-methyltransferase RsmG [Alphaproteobacteria bacterium]|nr:16S rRNA (guanine(527)-N(7))-methyltransferase RsmG [Alphaproteobacteria bacterium]
MSNAAPSSRKSSVPNTPQKERAEFIDRLKVSHETLRKLDRYAKLLAEWNAKFNLIGEATLQYIWTRHFLDSAQLMRFIPEGAKTLADMGSGAGFPGLVLSIMGFPETHLIESIGKKASFLRTVVGELELNVTVHQARIESLPKLKVDILTARALKPLPELLKLSNYLIKKDSLCLFLKGQSIDTELTESARSWTFKSEKHSSLSNPSGCVLIIKDLKPKHDAARKNHPRKR